MGDMHGTEMLKRLREDPTTRALPVVVVTSTVLERADEQELRSQASGIVSKSDLSRHVLGEAVRAALAARQEKPEPQIPDTGDRQPATEVGR